MRFLQRVKRFVRRLRSDLRTIWDIGLLPQPIPVPVRVEALMACFNVIALSPDGESAAQVFYKRDFARDEFFSRCSTGKPGSVVVMKVDGQEMARVTVQAKDA